MELSFPLRFLKLNQVPQAWVNAVWDTEFTEMAPMDDDNLEEELAACGEEDFRRLYAYLLALSEEQQSPSTDASFQSIWMELRENGVSVRSLVAVLSFFVLPGKAKAANVQQRVASLHAASLYLLLLGIPGSIGNNVFHEILLDTCLSASAHCWPQDFGKKRKKGTVKTSQAEGKRSKPHRKETQEMEVDEEEEELIFSSQDLNKIRDALVLLVQSLLRLLQTLSLKDRAQSACRCVQIFTKLIYFEPVIGEPDFSAERDVRELRSLPEMAFYGLQLICAPQHGDQKESLRRVFHRLLYVILMMNKEDRSRPTLLVLSHAVLAARDQAVRFVCHIVNELKEVALPLLKVLVQHICFQIVEKCEFRKHAAQAVGTLIAEMSSTDYAHFIKWLSDFSRQSKMVSRLFSVDVTMVLLGQPERRPEECDEHAALARYLPHRFLIQNLLFARRNDHSTTVQSHVLACLAECLELPSLNATCAIQSLFSATVTQTLLEGESTEGGSQHPQKSFQTLPFRTVEVASTESSVCDARENMALLMRRVQDSKCNVRKSALQALVGLLKHGVIPTSWENLSMLSERCRDPAVSVKKKALQCVDEILHAKPDCSLVQKAWLLGVVPAVEDGESSVQEKALEALEHILISQVKAYAACRHLDSSQRLTWKLLNLLCEECRNLSQYFSRAIAIWTKENKFTETFVTNLISHTEAEHSRGAWLLLSKVVSASPKIPYGKLMDAWDNMVSSKNVSATTCCHILGVIGDISAHLNEDTKARIVDDLMPWLKSFTMSLEAISAAIDTLHQIGSSEDVKQTQAFLNRHCGELVSICESYLAAIILTKNGIHNVDEELMVKHLHTFGVASLNCPARVSKRMILLVESVLIPNPDKLQDCQDELAASLPVFKSNLLPTKVRAHGVLTLAKVCLQHEELVRKYLPVFARELELGTEVAVRNNIVVVMCDLCVRYTNTVDRYIPDISACLRDDQTTIREHALIMLTNLLQEEFVKWKGSLFFRFMVVLVDPVPAIVSLCEYCLVHILLKKSPEMFSQHFIECIYHFNLYSGHNSYKLTETESGKLRFSLKGPQHREKRFRIYRFLLLHLTDAQRFKITNKMNQSVLACFANEELPLNADAEDILSDTFNILTLKEMKLQATGSAAGEEQDEENTSTMAKAVFQAAQNKVISQVRKKAFVEDTVPLVISLKRLLEQRQSPVLKDLTAYLQVTMQDYPQEVKEFFAGDEQLAAEVDFALKEAGKDRHPPEKPTGSCNLNEGSGMLAAQALTQRSTALSKSLQPFSFSTPQSTPHPNQLHARLWQSERRRHLLARTGSERQSNSIALGTTEKSQGVVNSRAISTPNGMGLNVTFEEGVSAIYNDQTSSRQESSVLHVRSDGNQPSGPRRWNEPSPFRPKKKSSL
ncbi:condensin-2 complex subunit D3 isoform X2 [Syngnathus typhle]|uniref:condensin-2 complex subunit D3 isoform X2 n=1 Tax=Syngnathus typhle TaxID=161592 RepID=UPI002A6ABF7B|nr:condensin-2 complex subunit D3 isoform X2 [Syngnathus typhle]